MADARQVPPQLVQAAIRAAAERGSDVADVPLPLIAKAAGISRSTLIRRLGGTRAALDAAVTAAGVDPGGRRPVRERAITAAATLIGQHGLAAITLEAVAGQASCSLPSLHALFGGRDGLLAAVFDQYMPLTDVEAFLADPPQDPREVVAGIHQRFAGAFTATPSVFPAILADVLARPTGPGGNTWVRHILPRLLASIGAWLTTQTRTGRFRPYPIPVLAQLLIGPLAMHLLLRPALAPALGPAHLHDALATFTDAFLAAVTAP